MNFKKILCPKCLKKLRKVWAEEKREYRKRKRSGLQPHNEEIK
jgi:hypothetical protein